MTEQLVSREIVISDAKLCLELTNELKIRHKDYPDRKLSEITNFLTRLICDTSGRLRDQSALLEFQIKSGMV